MMLTQQETNKVKERDDQHTLELREWRGDIAKRKQVCIYSCCYGNKGWHGNMY